MVESNGTTPTPTSTISLPQPTVIITPQENKTVITENKEIKKDPTKADNYPADLTVTIANATPLPTTIIETVKTNEKKEKNPVGRPPIIDDDRLHKLKTAFLMGCDDRLACAYADVSNGAFYNYQNAHPEFLEQKEKWKANPLLKALNTIFKNLDREDTAKWYAERKLKKEFSTRQEITGPDNQSLQIEIIDQKPKG